VSGERGTGNRGPGRSLAGKPKLGGPSGAAQAGRLGKRGLADGLRPGIPAPCSPPRSPPFLDTRPPIFHTESITPLACPKGGRRGEIV